MITKNKIVINKSSLTVLFWVLIVYLLSGSPYTTINTEISMIIVGLAGIVLPNLVIVKKKSMPLSYLPLILIIIMVFISMAWHSEFNSRFYWRVLAIVIVSYYLLKKYGLSNIIQVYIKFMVIVSILSLIGYILLNCTQILYELPSVRNINNVTYGMGIVFNYIKLLPERNCGIFWEPGIFASYLALAIVFECITETESVNKFRIILFIVTIITTTSSAGYVLLVLSLGVILLRKPYLSKYKRVLAILFIIILGVIVLNIDDIILNTSLVNNKYLLKLTSEKMVKSARMTAIFHNLNIFNQNIILGTGINYVLENMSSWADISTSTYILSIFGFLGLFYTIFIIWGIFSQKQINIFVKILFSCILMSIVNKEPHINILFTWIIILGMASNRNAFHKNTVNYKNSSL